MSFGSFWILSHSDIVWAPFAVSGLVKSTADAFPLKMTALPSCPTAADPDSIVAVSEPTESGEVVDTVSRCQTPANPLRNTIAEFCGAVEPPENRSWIVVPPGITVGIATHALRWPVAGVHDVI